MSSFNNNNSNLDNLLLQTLMDRLHLYAPINPFISQSLENFLFDAAITLDDDDDDDDDYEFGHQNDDMQLQLMKEESKLEREIIKVILSGNMDSLKRIQGRPLRFTTTTSALGFMRKMEILEYIYSDWLFACTINIYHLDLYSVWCIKLDKKHSIHCPVMV